MSAWMELTLDDRLTLHSKYVLPLCWPSLFDPSDMRTAGHGEDLEVWLETDGSSARLRLRQCAAGSHPLLVRDVALLLRELAVTSRVRLGGELLDLVDHHADADDDPDPDPDTRRAQVSAWVADTFRPAAPIDYPDIARMERDPERFVRLHRTGEHFRDAVAGLVLGRPDPAAWTEWWAVLRPPPAPAPTLPGPAESARGFVQLLTARGLLEATVTDRLADDLAALLARTDADRIGDLEALLLAHPDVEELYGDADELGVALFDWG